jgi:ABC-type proline/glycine betaine transport systems, ATPase components
MIKEISLKFGPNSYNDNLNIDLTPITVFIGPNNSGKSKLLIEIERYCKSGTLNQQDVILKNINFEPINNIDEEIEKFTIEPSPHHNISTKEILFGKLGQERQIFKDNLRNLLTNPLLDPESFCSYYISLNTLRLDGASRISLIKSQPLGDLQKPNHTALVQLFVHKGLS